MSHKKELPSVPAPTSMSQLFVTNFRADITSGFLVFLIALPLCLGISLASGFPPIAGVFTAIVGSLIATCLSNSEMTIKGPAAGLIVVVFGAMQDFGYTGGTDLAADLAAYHRTLAVCVVAGLLQIVFGLRRAGILGDFFPTSVVHGMLAAIGVIIMLKQLPVAVGQKAPAEPIEIIRELPHIMMEANPQIALIGGVSLLILFGFGFWKARTRLSIIKGVPAQLLVLLVAVPLGMWLDLSHEHTYSFAGHEYKIGEQFLVNVPNNLLEAVAFPDWTVLVSADYWYLAIKWILMISLIGSIESLLSAKAVDMIDPARRKSDLNRDLLAVGVANSLVATIGGLPMISEIVRSKANIDNGGRSRFANMWHGLFLLAFVALVPALIHRVPLAALAAMLVYTGSRLASPHEFFNVYKIGREQLFIFVVTLIAVLATDLLIGIGIGIAVKLGIHLLNGLPFRSVLKPYLQVIEEGDHQVTISARESAVFSNFIPFRRQIEQIGLVGRNNVTVDLSQTTLVDHSVMEQLHELEDEFDRQGLTLTVVGLDSHRQLSEHPMSARKQTQTTVRRVTVIAGQAMEMKCRQAAEAASVASYTILPCTQFASKGFSTASASEPTHVRIEVIASRPEAMEFVRLASQFLRDQTDAVVTVESIELKTPASIDKTPS